MNKAKILVIDDEPEIQETLFRLLSAENYLVETVGSAEEAVAVTEVFLPELIVCDINLPGMSGMDFCKWVKAHFPDILLIFLSGIHDEFDKVLGLELGAEDYITKPFSPREFKARIKVALRRLNPVRPAEEARDGKLIRWKDLVVDIARRKVTLLDRDIPLTKKEFDILVLLASRPGQVYSREEILNRIWPDDVHVSDRTVDVHIGRLRDKIEENADLPKYIETVRGVGYRFSAGDEG